MYEKDEIFIKNDKIIYFFEKKINFIFIIFPS